MINTHVQNVENKEAGTSDKDVVDPAPDHDLSVSGIGKITRRLVRTSREVILSDHLKKLFYNLLTALLTVSLILSVSVFTYGAFYFAYMPAEVHEESLNFQFSPCISTSGVCSFPNATLVLDPRNHRLMIGQHYSIDLLLEVPDSVANQELGMFMSCLKIMDTNQRVTQTSCKSSILEFRSPLLRLMETLLFSPFLILGTTTQRQWVTVTYFTDFLDNASTPASQIVVELQSKFIQVYSANLQIHAKLSGLRHIMYHHPWLSSVTGVIANIIILTILILISSARFLMPSDEFPAEELGWSSRTSHDDMKNTDTKSKRHDDNLKRRHIEIMK